MYYEFRIRRVMARLGMPATHEAFLRLTVFETAALAALD